MAFLNFDKCMAFVFAREAGYVNDPDDDGGPTNMGITMRTLAQWRGHPVSVQDVKDLAKGEARAIYHQHYWMTVSGDALPPGVDLIAFDFGVNAGPVRAVMELQRALRIASDGHVGPITLRSIGAFTPTDLINRYTAARLSYYQGLAKWPVFKNGWSVRIAEARAAAIGMATAKSPS